MKKILLTASLFCSLTCFCQTITKETLLKKMSAEICDELAKKVESKKKIDNLETELGLAMLPTVTKYTKEIKEVYKSEPFEGNTMEVVGEDLGGIMATDCPAFVQLLTNNSEATADLISGNKKSTGSVKGTFIKLVEAEFSYVEVKNSTGKIEKLFWMDYFEGADNLVSQPNKFSNKKVKVSYVEKEVYRASIKEYVKIKVISSIEIDN